jgi:TatD DNase family protein
MFSPKEDQLKWFEAQVKLAVKLKAPLFLHEREGHEDLVSVLSKYQ